MNIIYYLVPSAGQEAMFKCVLGLHLETSGSFSWRSITIKPCIFIYSTDYEFSHLAVRDTLQIIVLSQQGGQNITYDVMLQITSG